VINAKGKQLASGDNIRYPTGITRFLIRMDLDPFIVIDLETTGIPNGHGFEPRIIEVGTALVDAEGHVEPGPAFFVRQPETHLFDHRARSAYRITGIDPQMVLERGLAENEAARTLLDWIAEMKDRYDVKSIRAFNSEFDFAFVDREPWNLFQNSGLKKGRCIMKAAVDVMGPAGALPAPPPYIREQRPEEKYKWPKFTEALAYFNGRGYAIGWDSAAHRASQDAIKEALVAVAIERELQGLEPEEEKKLLNGCGRLYLGT